MPHQSRGRGDLGGGDEIEGAEFIGRAPAPPVANTVADFAEIGQRRHGAPPFTVLGCSPPAFIRAPGYGTGQFVRQAAGDIPTVDPQDLAGDIARGPAVQEQQRRRLFDWIGGPPQRFRDPVEIVLAVGGAQLVQDGCFGDTGSGAVHPDTAGRQFHRLPHRVEDDRFFGEPVAAVGSRFGICCGPANSVGHGFGLQQALDRPPVLQIPGGGQRRDTDHR